VSLAIYAVDGRLVKSLAKGTQEAGRYQAVWNGTEEGGAAARSGVYFVRFEGGGVKTSRLFTLVR
jgi:flagellar hook assembly protein FlgD